MLERIAEFAVLWRETEPSSSANFGEVYDLTWQQILKPTEEPLSIHIAPSDRSIVSEDIQYMFTTQGGT